MASDEQLVADELARLAAIAATVGDEYDNDATAAYLQSVILSRLTAAQAATVLREMAADALEHFGDRRRERSSVSGMAASIEGVLMAAWERTWTGTVYRMHRMAVKAKVAVPGGRDFWNEGHFSYLGRRFLARRHGADA
jgi:hypothetical protein